jgi:hypothetical protein
MQADPLVPHDRQSRWVTRTSANRPSVNDTVIFAFKSTALRSRAYQAFMPEPQLRLAQLERGNSTAGTLPTTMAQVEPNQFYLERRIVKEPVKFPLIGGDFSGSKTALSVSSQGDFDGKTYRFLVSVILSGDPIQNIRAPYINALRESESPEALITRLRNTEISLTAIPSGQRQYSVAGIIPAERMPAGYIYIIDQPITFTPEVGRVCFTVPTYSPANSP